MTSAAVYPGADEVKVAWPVPESSAVSVTFCAVDQFRGVKVSVPPPVTDRPPLPAVRDVVTVTSEDGASDNLTAYVAVAPCAIVSAAGLATTLASAVTVTPTGADSAVAPVLSVTLA